LRKIRWFSKKTTEILRNSIAIPSMGLCARHPGQYCVPPSPTPLNLTPRMVDMEPSVPGTPNVLAHNARRSIGLESKIGLLSLRLEERLDVSLDVSVSVSPSVIPDLSLGGSLIANPACRPKWRRGNSVAVKGRPNKTCNSNRISSMTKVPVDKQVTDVTKNRGVNKETKDRVVDTTIIIPVTQRTILSFLENLRYWDG